MRNRFHRVLASVLLSVTATAAAGESNAQSRAPVPQGAALEASQKAAADLYGDRFRSAKTLADKTAVAADMIEAALQLQDGSADQYVLLTIAREIAAGAGDAATALRAAEKQAERFDVSAAKLKAETLLTAAREAATTAQHKAVAETALLVVGNLTDADEIELARDVCEAGRAAAAKSRQFALVKELAAKADDLKKQQASSAEYRRALAEMDDDPAEPAANLAAGRYLCLVKGDWVKGVPMLALGSDAALKAVALMELRGADSAEQQAAIGNAWWDAAETRQSAERNTLRLRAGVWYRQAEPNLTGSLAGLKVKQRLEQLAELRLSDTALVERAGSVKERLVFQFNDKVFTEKYWEWSGEWEMTEEGGKAPPGNPDKSFLRSRHGYTSDVVIDMDFSFSRAKYSNHGDCWITMWGKQLIISVNWPALTAKVHIHREGNEIVYVLNGQEQRIAVEPQVGSKPTIIDLYWRSRTSHFRRIEIKADRMVPVNAKESPEPATGPDTKGAKAPRQPSSGVQPGRELAGMIGRARASGNDVGLVLRYQPGRIFPQQTFDDLLAKQGIPSRDVQIELGGALRLDKTTSVLVTHKGGSSDRGVLRLYLNGRELGVVGDNHTKDTTYQVELPSGLHVIRWVLTGGAIGGGNMIQFVDSRTNQPLPVHVPAEATAQVRSMPFRSEVDVSSQ